MPKKCCNTSMSYLPDRVTIQSDTSTDSSPIPAYATAFATDVPCRITPGIVGRSGDETFRGQQLEAKEHYTIAMRYKTGITPKMRVLVTGGIYKDRLLNISSAIPEQELGQAPVLNLTCTELVVV